MKINTCLVLSALFTSLVSYQIWKITWEDFFMWGMTMKDVLLTVVVLKMAREVKDYWTTKAAWVFLSFNSIDMLDEWFGTPLGCGYNEYVAAGVCAIIVYKEELWLDKIFYYSRKRFYIFGNRFFGPWTQVYLRFKPILLTKIIKPVANVFKRRDG